MKILISCVRYNYKMHQLYIDTTIDYAINEHEYYENFEPPITFQLWLLDYQLKW